jgi:glycerol kinase
VLAALQREATALGAAFLAGLKVGIWKDTAAVRKLTQEGKTFVPKMSEDERKHRLIDWRRAVRAVIAFYTAK